MTQAIEKAKVSNLSQVTGYDDRIIQLIRQTVCPGASALELAVFLYNAKRLGLDPMTRQIYWIQYAAGKPGEIVIGINGYRAQAEDSQVYAGSDDPEYEYEKVGQPDGAPSKCTVTVWKMVQGQRVPFTASVRWEEFYPGEGKAGEQYRKRPHNQLAIRAESHALRKAFPQQTERLEIQAAPTTWEQAAIADESARVDPAKQKRDSDRYGEVFDVYDDGPSRVKRPRPSSQKSRSSEPVQPEPDPEVEAEEDRAAVEEFAEEERARAAEIAERANAAATERDRQLDEIEAARQKKQEGLL